MQVIKMKATIIFSCDRDRISLYLKYKTKPNKTADNCTPRVKSRIE